VPALLAAAPDLLAAAPALPLDEAGRYVAGAYVVFLALLIVYVAIMAAKLQRIERELRELGDFAEQGSPARASDEVADSAAKGSQSVGAMPAAPGREAEEAAVDSKTQPPTGSDRNLTLSESVGGRPDNLQGESDRGTPDV
jgi:hypothetical protein